MDIKKAVVVKTFSNLAEAQMIQINLESMGIDTCLKKDDVGGAYPSLQIARGVQLLVNPEDVSEVKKILEEYKTEEVTEVEKKVVTSKYKGWAVLVLGVVLGIFLTTIGYMLFYRDHSMLNGEVGYDTSGDGKNDETYVYSEGELLKIVRDRNYDGNLDNWCYYKSRKITRCEFDNNFDGKIDGWVHFNDMNNFTSEFDTDFNGIPDLTCSYSDRVKKRIDWQPNGTKTIERSELFTHGIKTAELIDTDKDGVFDLKITFDPFGKEIRRENIQ